MLSVPHLIVIFVIVLVVFGPQKLPELARGLGKLMAEFRKASLDFRFAFEEEMRAIERQALEAKRAFDIPEAQPSAAPEQRLPLSAGTPEPADAADRSGGETPWEDPGTAETPADGPAPDGQERATGDEQR
jgi:TatA/E family protein of Tat protein translocase